MVLACKLSFASEIMNTKHIPRQTSSKIPLIRGMTIIELSVTLGLMLSLASVVVMSANGITDWKLARNAGLDLRSVYVAQKSYLADHPTNSIATVVAADLSPYMPLQGATIPSVESLEGTQLPINFNVIPPVVVNGGSTYDPSGNSMDGLWDVGKP